MNEKAPSHYLQGDLPKGLTGQEVEVVTPAQEQLEAARRIADAKQTLGRIEEAVTTEGEALDETVDRTVAEYVGDGLRECTDDDCRTSVTSVGIVEAAKPSDQPHTAKRLNELLASGDDAAQAFEQSMNDAQQAGVDVGEVMREMDEARTSVLSEVLEGKDRQEYFKGIYSRLTALQELPDEELLGDMYVKEIDRLVTAVEAARGGGSRQEYSSVRAMISVIEKRTKSSRVDWPEMLVNSPDDCDPHIRSLLESGNGTVLQCALAAQRRWKDAGNYIHSKENARANIGESEDLLRRFMACERVILGRDKTVRAMFKEYTDSLEQYGVVQSMSNRPPLMTDMGVDSFLEYIRATEHLGRENALKLHKRLGIANFSRWSLATLKSAVDLINGVSSPDKQWSAVLAGKKGDHNGAFFVFQAVRSEDVIPLEVGNGTDIEDRVEALRELGVEKISRLTIAGHGGRDGLLLSSGYVLPRDTNKLAKNPVSLLVDMIRSDADGFRNIGLVSCFGAYQFDGKKSLSDCIAHLGQDIAVHAPPTTSRPRMTDQGIEQSAPPLVANLIPEEIIEKLSNDGYKVAEWIHEQLWKHRRYTIVRSTARGRDKRRKTIMKIGGSS